MEKILKHIINYSLLIIIFLLPLFFLPITIDFFGINKLYLLSFAGLFLIFISSAKLLFSKTLVWKKSALDLPIFSFLLAIVLSIIISSPNKTQALLNPNFGLILFLSLTLMYFYLSFSPITQLLHYSITFSGLILSILTIIFYFQPFKNLNLPYYLQFLKTPGVSPIGNSFDLISFLGMALIFNIFLILKKQTLNNQRNPNKFELIINYFVLIINLLALFISAYSIFPLFANFFHLSAPTPQLPTSLILPPLRLSWYSAVEILKNPLTLFFGIGVDNFSAIFTKVKDIAYNQSNLWSIYSFNYSRSAILHIITEAGILGLLAFFLIVVKSLSISRKNPFLLTLFLYSLLTLVFLPPTLVNFWIFFTVLGLISHWQKNNFQEPEKKLDLSDFPLIYGGTFVFSIIIVTFASYFLGRNYLSEISFKKSIEAIVKNNLKDVYDNQRQAIILNPYVEKYYLNLSQINLTIANNIAQKYQATQSSQIKEEDRQAISQAIQQAITLAKDGAVRLNPQKAQNWENLATIYKNIIGIAQDAQVWAISSYQRAIVADPQNPVYRLNLGGIYYILGNYDDAINLFNQAVSLKPDWPNAYYNLAWAYYQKGAYQQAASTMENVLKLLDKEKNKQDWEKAQKELEMFKNKLKEQESQNEKSKSNQLNLPEAPKTTIEPKIGLPDKAKP
ncbi:MAG: tetratricopeptide repeat protein [Microgenomates group bacterium]